MRLSSLITSFALPVLLGGGGGGAGPRMELILSDSLDLARSWLLGPASGGLSSDLEAAGMPTTGLSSLNLLFSENLA
jgi:hypothetical protein